VLRLIQGQLNKASKRQAATIERRPRLLQERDESSLGVDGNPFDLRQLGVSPGIRLRPEIHREVAHDDAATGAREGVDDHRTTGDETR